MTGGVSLAIWMAGVAREINLLAQASQWRRVGGELPADNGLKVYSEQSLRLYRKLIDVLDVVVDVDILSGTSAGGINAALLASSRVTGSDLGGLRDIWLDLGALTELIRNPTDKTTPSLLYGDERMLCELVNKIPDLKSGPFPPAKFPKKLGNPSTTVYVTTTLLDGETSEFTDSFGTLVQDVDRRGVFTFTEEDLAATETFPALALAARSSASFPVAFEPSFVPFTQPAPKTKDVPERPAMADYINITRPHWVADGGLLDNQPIDVLLKRIFDRRAERPVRRALLFVVPSSGPQVVQEAPADSVNEPLGLLDGLLKDLTAVTTQSIAADLRTIRAHQDRMEARTDAKLRLAELAARLPGSRLLTEPLLDDYENREATKQSQALTSVLLRQLSTWSPGSSSTTDTIPKAWQPQLAIGGNAAKTCRQAIKWSILTHWSRPKGLPLPLVPADLVRYGQAAFDLAKGSALGVVQAAYQLAQDPADFEALAVLTKGIHQADEPVLAADQSAKHRRAARWPLDLTDVVRKVCANEKIRQGTLEDAAAAIAEEYLDRSGVPEQAWSRLETVFRAHCDTLTRLANAASGADSTKQESLLGRNHAAAKQLSTYLNYLRPQDNVPAITIRLFDLAATQRAMLPADADIEQPLELVQVSADTRSLLAPNFHTAEQKLTGMQLHHFGAFYKRSWRANDWMWGRLDGAGWLVHVLLDPRRLLRVVPVPAGERNAGKTNAQWFISKLKTLGAPEFPVAGYQLPATGRVPGAKLTEQTLLDELKFLDDETAPIPCSLPNTALWLAQVWQRRVLDEELSGLASTVLNPSKGNKPDWSPTRSRSWASDVLAAGSPEAKYALLKDNPVAGETFLTDKGSPLMARTITKAAATASAAVGSVRQVPSVLKPPLATVRTLTLGGYRVVSTTKGVPKWSILIGAAILVLGVVLAIQSTTVVGITGLAVAGIGAYLVVLGAWQRSSRLLFALLSITVVGAVLSLGTPVVSKWLFGEKDQEGLVGRNVYWLGTQWWYPLAAVGVIAVAVTMLGAANPRRK
jgi:patatin-related protein